MDTGDIPLNREKSMSIFINILNLLQLIGQPSNIEFNIHLVSSEIIMIINA